MHISWTICCQATPSQRHSPVRFVPPKHRLGHFSLELQALLELWQMSRQCACFAQPKGHLDCGSKWRQFCRFNRPSSVQSPAQSAVSLGSMLCWCATSCTGWQTLMRVSTRGTLAAGVALPSFQRESCVSTQFLFRHQSLT